jgi:hypothetical protein
MTGAGSEELQGLLFTTARSRPTCGSWSSTRTPKEIVFDTATGDDWVGDRLTGVERPQSVVLANAGRGSIFGTFIHTNGSRWLVFAEPDPALGLALIFYAQPEPTAG